MPIGFHVGKKSDGTERMFAIPFWLLLVIVSILGILAAIFVPAQRGASGM
jgi:hypothetical protein